MRQLLAVILFCLGAFCFSQSGAIPHFKARAQTGNLDLGISKSVPSGGAIVALDTSGWAINPNGSGLTAGGAASSPSSGAGSPLFFTYTPVGTPTSVGVVIQNYEGGTNEAITGVTYGGTSMSLAGTKLAVPTTSTFLYIFCLANPPSGAQTVILQVSGTPSFISVYAGAFTVTSSSVSTCLRSGSYISTASGSAQNNISSTVTAQAGDFVFDNVQNWNGSAGVAMTKGGGQTSFGFWSSPAGQDSSYKSAVGTSTTMSWTTSSNTNWAQNAAAIQHQ